ncbi:MAG: hypothetical protein QOF28_1254, partial [Actinomycetota bacterium]|nr:hypothetical protein [Actinomycetota bacterium]
MSADSVIPRARLRPTWRRYLPWIVGGAAVIAVLIFVGVKYSNTGHSANT